MTCKDEILHNKSNIELLKYYRELNNMNQRILANKSGVCLSVIIKLELGSTPFTLSNSEKISKVLNVSASIFYDDYLKFIINSQKNLKKIREYLKLTKTQFSFLLETDRCSIRDWESGKSIISRISYLKLIDLLEKILLNI